MILMFIMPSCFCSKSRTYTLLLCTFLLRFIEKVPGFVINSPFSTNISRILYYQEVIDPGKRNAGDLCCLHFHLSLKKLAAKTFHGQWTAHSPIYPIPIIVLMNTSVNRAFRSWTPQVCPSAQSPRPFCTYTMFWLRSIWGICLVTAKARGKHKPGCVYFSMERTANVCVLLMTAIFSIPARRMGMIKGKMCTAVVTVILAISERKKDACL